MGQSVGPQDAEHKPAKGWGGRSGSQSALTAGPAAVPPTTTPWMLWSPWALTTRPPSLTLAGDDFLLLVISSTGEDKALDAEFQRRHFLALGRGS